MPISEENPGAGSGGQVRRRRRRRWSEAQKRQIVAETHEPGVSVPMVVQRYNLNANRIFGWRRLFREAERVGGVARFLDDGRICLTNDASERALRPLCLKRKSWLFCGGARAAHGRR